tara:strand:- start:21305 stop:21424 length:120 start_codon:yes stop_codon:yes gene_type:complete
MFHWYFLIFSCFDKAILIDEVLQSEILGGFSKSPFEDIV